MWVDLEEAAQSFIEDHLYSLNLLRKHIWGDREKNSQIKNITTCLYVGPAVWSAPLYYHCVTYTVLTF